MKYTSTLILRDSLLATGKTEQEFVTMFDGKFKEWHKTVSGFKHTKEVHEADEHADEGHLFLTFTAEVEAKDG